MLSAAPTAPGRLRERLLVFAIIACSATLNALCLPSLAPTYDEPMHYRYGARILRGDASRFDNSKMPISALNALPARLGIAPDPFAGPAPSASRGLLIARLVTVLFSSTCLLVVYAWASELFGTPAGLLALTLAGSEPNLSAHAQLVTTDSFATGLILLAAWRFWKFQTLGGWRNALACALATAFALLGKYTSVYLFPLFAGMAIARWLLRRGEPGEARPSAREALPRFLGWAGVFAVVAVLVVNLGFLFDRTFVPLGQYAFRSEMFRAFQRLPLLGSLPVPVPYPFLEGLDWVKFTELTGADVGTPYLLGRLHPPSSGPIPGYYLFAVLYKVPLPLLLLGGLGLILASRPRRNGFWEREWFLLAPALSFTVYFNFFFRYQAGIRFLLVAFPFFLILAGGVAAEWSAWRPGRRGVIVALLGWQLASVASWFPWYIPYFNELVLDRTLAFQKLADSNLDWGQADASLDAYVSEHPDVLPNPAGPVPGRIAVSANLLTGVLLPERMSWLRGRWEPDGNVAYANLLFTISEDSLRRYGLLSADPRGDAKRYVETGIQLLRAGRWDQAASTFGTALRLDPLSADAWARLGVAHHQRERFREAERAYWRALELAPLHPQAWRNLAYLLREEGRLAEEIAALGQALAANPNDPDLARRLAAARTEAGAADGGAARRRGAPQRPPPP